MSFIVVVALFAGGLFLCMYLTKRRLGVLGLALAAGAVLSSLWVKDLTPLVAQAGIELVRPPLGSVVATSLTLLPAIVLLFSGPSYKQQYWRLIGSAMFALLAITLLLDPLGNALVMDANGKAVYVFLNQYKNIIISAALVLSIFDLFLAKTPKPSKEH